MENKEIVRNVLLSDETELMKEVNKIGNAFNAGMMYASRLYGNKEYQNAPDMYDYIIETLNLKEK